MASRKTKRQGVFPPLLKRPSTKKNEVSECGKCGVEWKKNDATRSYFLLPCRSRHTLCPICFSLVMASKGAMHFFNCPCCEGECGKEKYTYWDVFSPQKTRHNGAARQKSETHFLSFPDPTLNPVLHHHANSIMSKRQASMNTFTLSLARTTKNKEGKAILNALSLPILTDNIDASINDKDRKKLINLFQLLHPVLVLSSKRTFQHQYDNLTSKSERGSILFDAASVDNTCLFQCIYSLSTGKASPSSSEIMKFESTQRKKLLVQIIGIVEMIRSQCVWKGRSILKDIVGQQLMVNCSSQALYRMLNQLDISNNNETVRIDAIKDSKNKILAGYPLKGKRYDLFLILFDNLGFRCRGGKNLKVGYEQYTALELVNIPK